MMGENETLRKGYRERMAGKTDAPSVTGDGAEQCPQYPMHECGVLFPNRSEWGEALHTGNFTEQSRIRSESALGGDWRGGRDQVPRGYCHRTATYLHSRPFAALSARPSSCRWFTRRNYESAWPALTG